MNLLGGSKKFNMLSSVFTTCVSKLDFTKLCKGTLESTRRNKRKFTFYFQKTQNLFSQKKQKTKDEPSLMWLTGCIFYPTGLFFLHIGYINHSVSWHWPSSRMKYQDILDKLYITVWAMLCCDVEWQKSDRRKATIEEQLKPIWHWDHSAMFIF